MTESASQFNRIVQMVAELSRHERDGEPALRIAEVAARLGVRPDDVVRDIRTLTALRDDAEQDWLSSLSVLQEGNAIELSSRGPFRRPVRLTPEELLAIQVGLADDGGPGALSRDLAELFAAGDAAGRQLSALERSGPDETRIVDLARRAAEERRCVEILYARSGAAEPASRVVEIHRVISAGGKFYLVAWCRSARARRHFRADRVLTAQLLARTFESRPELGAPDDGYEVFLAPAAEADTVTVRFRPAVARWIAEQYPDAVREADGSVLADFVVGDAAWLTRMVLQYGADAEVIRPDEYRALMRAACVAA